MSVEDWVQRPRSYSPVPMLGGGLPFHVIGSAWDISVLRGDPSAQ